MAAIHRSKRLAPAGVAVALLATAFVMPTFDMPAASAGEIEGQIHLPGGITTRRLANPYPGRVRAASTQPAKEATDELADAVVYIERVEPPFKVTPPVPPAMAQQGQQFVPRVVPVVIHQVVDFPNQDPVYHNVFSFSPCCRFDLGRYPRGKSRQVTFDETGIVRVFCEIHSDMAGYVLVLQNPYFTQPVSDGKYRLAGVPEGQHTLVFWHPEIGRRDWPVTVPPDGMVRFDLGL